MEKKPIKRKTIWITSLVLAAIITTVTWASQNKIPFGIPGQPLFRNLSNSPDTLPKKGKSKTKQEPKEYDDSFNSRDLDKALEDVKKSLQRLEMELKKTDWKKYKSEMNDAFEDFNSEKLKAELDAALNKDDWKKYDEEMRESMKSIDMLKLKGELDATFDKEAWKKANEEMKESMKELNNEQLFREKDQLFGKMDMEKLKREMDESKWEMELNKEKMKLDFDKLGDELKDVQIDFEHANIELKNLKSLLHEFEKDGLIKKGKPYQIKIEKGDLYIDGKKQPDTISNKYRKDERFKKFFDKDNNFNMNSDGKDDKDEDDWL